MPASLLGCLAPLQSIVVCPGAVLPRRQAEETLDACVFPYLVGLDGGLAPAEAAVGLFYCRLTPADCDLCLLTRYPIKISPNPKQGFADGDAARSQDQSSTLVSKAVVAEQR